MIGGLKPFVIKNSDEIIEASLIKNDKVPKGFSKFSTQSFQSPSGNFQVHFYMNAKSGNVFYDVDYKAVYNATSGK